MNQIGERETDIPSAPKKYRVTQFTRRWAKDWWLNIEEKRVWIFPCSTTPNAETVKLSVIQRVICLLVGCGKEGWWVGGWEKSVGLPRVLAPQ